MSKYPPDVLTPENLASCIDDNARKITDLEQLLINDEHFGVYGLSVRIDELEKRLSKKWKPSYWLAKFGL